MKKSFSNLTTSMALSALVFSGSVLSTQANADTPVSTDNNSSNSKTTETYLLPGMGVGAATGTVIAGPVGLLIGGLIGAAIGSNQEVTQAAEITLPQEIISSASNEENRQNNTILVAQAGPIDTVIEDQTDSPQEELMNILVTDLSLDVYFRSGSSDIEKFYPARLSAIAGLMHAMDELELHLDGYTDRRGDKSQNTALANKRIEKVRQQLINAGVAENRIISKAFGEMKMVSAAGDLEAYTFDRKVVIRFERTSHDSTASMTTALSNFTTEEAAISNNEKNLPPVLAETNSRF